MADSNIVCSGLVAVGGIGQVALGWAVEDPNANGLPYLALDAVEVWAATTNDRGGASKIAEGSTFAIHSGVPEEQSRFYWIRARTRSGLYGEWFPVSATAGVQGTATTATVMRAGLIEGGIIQTAGSGRRIEMSGERNLISAYREDGTNVSATFGDSEDIGLPFLVFAAGRDDARPKVAAAAFTNKHNHAVDARTIEAILTKPTAAAFYGVAPIYAFYAQSGSYGPFTGSHEGVWRRDVPLPEIGDLIADRRILFRNGVSNAMAEMEIGVAGGSPVVGVLVGSAELSRVAAIPDAVSKEEFEALAETYLQVCVNALGEGQINVCDLGGPIRAGDLLCASPVPGKAMRQADDIVRSTTVARAREASDGRSQLACIYLAG